MSYHGPSSNVSAISRPVVGPLLTNAGPLGHAADELGRMQRRQPSPRAGYSVWQTRSGFDRAPTGVQCARDSVFCTCQRIGR